QYGEDKRDYLPEDNRPKNPLYGKITPARAAEMVRSGNTAPLIEANGIATQAGDWLWGTLQGDFNQNPSTSQIVVGTLISMIPIIDQVMDLRDITANVMLLTDDDEANDTDAWLAFTLTGIGLVPSCGLSRQRRRQGYLKKHRRIPLCCACRTTQARQRRPS
ncbi:hypothetical protein DS891_05375, partial [Pseudoalteromonas sp. JC28]|nr:hypothetical protein [Pseudoalteromonas sp. JC28]